ncbi:MAG: low molecular weight phosphotyrosine protein phosphatase [Micrococcales bacterium]|nr:low molecular weight phosphotyrosine protein phosphatase [Micrococcales bacterium]
MADLATPPAFQVCFVCTGNICRSPTAEIVFRSLIHDRGLGERLTVSSAGTGDWHVGEMADPRAIRALARRGYDGSAHRARQFDPDSFDRLDLVVAFDRGQERFLTQAAPTDADRAKVGLLLSFDPEAGASREVPDPYYSDSTVFDDVLALIERACLALFRQIEPGVRAG